MTSPTRTVMPTMRLCFRYPMWFALLWHAAMLVDVTGLYEINKWALLAPVWAVSSLIFGNLLVAIYKA